MEVVAQWLDDIEDLFFALPLAWERLRVWCLHVGLLSALTLAAQRGFHVLVEWSLTFAAAAALSVCVWAIGLIASKISGWRYGFVRANSALTP